MLSRLFAGPKSPHRTSQPPGASLFAQTVHRTKTFHVKHFCPIRAWNRSKEASTLGGWKPAPDLREVLLRAIHDEERANQRSAARALGRLYAGDESVQQRLRDTLRSTLDLSVAAAALEALTLGWPETPNLSELHNAASTSKEATLRLVGISGRLTSWPRK